MKTVLLRTHLWGMILASLFFVACGDDSVVDYVNYEIEYEISQTHFPGNGGDAVLTLRTMGSTKSGISSPVEAGYEVSFYSYDGNWVEIEQISENEYKLKVAVNNDRSPRNGRVYLESRIGGNVVQKDFEISQDQTEKTMGLISLWRYRSGDSANEFLPDNEGWKRDCGPSEFWIEFYVYGNGKPEGVTGCDWIRVKEVTEDESQKIGSRHTWNARFKIGINSANTVRSSTISVKLDAQELGPYKVEQQAFKALTWPTEAKYEYDAQSWIGIRPSAQWLTINCFTDEEPQVDPSCNWVEVNKFSHDKTDEISGKNYKEWDLEVYCEKNTGSARSTVLQCWTNGLPYSDWINVDIVQAAGNGGSGGSGGGSADSYKTFNCSAWYTTTGGYDSLIAVESTVSHLNSYGIMVYKSGTSYYFENFENEKVYVTPGSTNTYTYCHDVIPGDRYNNYRTQTVTIYVRFSFSAF